MITKYTNVGSKPKFAEKTSFKKSLILKKLPKEEKIVFLLVSRIRNIIQL